LANSFILSFGETPEVIIIGDEVVGIL